MRAVCAVLALDAAVEEEVAVLRRNLLRLVHTREFAPEAAFKVLNGRHITMCHGSHHASTSLLR